MQSRWDDFIYRATWRVLVILPIVGLVAFAVVMRLG